MLNIEKNPINKHEIKEKLFDLIEKSYPICRSISGNGVRETLKLISKVIPIEQHEVATGTKVFDWEIP